MAEKLSQPPNDLLLYETEEGEWIRDSVAQNATTAAAGKTYQVDYSRQEARQRAELKYQEYRKRLELQPSEVDKHLADTLKKLDQIEQKPNS